MSLLARNDARQTIGDAAPVAVGVMTRLQRGIIAAGTAFRRRRRRDISRARAAR